MIEQCAVGNGFQVLLDPSLQVPLAQISKAVYFAVFSTCMIGNAPVSLYKPGGGGFEHKGLFLPLPK